MRDHLNELLIGELPALVKVREGGQGTQNCECTEALVRHSRGSDRNWHTFHAVQGPFQYYYYYCYKDFSYFWFFICPHIVPSLPLFAIILSLLHTQILLY